MENYGKIAFQEGEMGEGSLKPQGRQAQSRWSYWGGDSGGSQNKGPIRKEDGLGDKCNPNQGGA